MFYFYTLLKRQKTNGLRTLGDIEMKNELKWINAILGFPKKWNDFERFVIERLQFYW